MRNQFQDALNDKIRKIVTEVLQEMLIEGKVSEGPVKKVSLSDKNKKVLTNKNVIGALKGRVTDPSKDMRLKVNRNKKR